MKQKILKQGSYDQEEIMMFDDCKSKNMPGQFTTAHISGCGYLYKHCRFEMKDLNLSTRPFDLMQQPNHCIYMYVSNYSLQQQLKESPLIVICG